MSAVLQRMRDRFSRKPRIQQLPPGSFPNPSGAGEAQTLGTITKPPYPTDDDEFDDDAESIGAYNVPEQTQLRGQQRDTTRSEDPYAKNPTGTPITMNTSIPPIRNGPQTDFPSNNNRGPTSFPPAQSGSPFAPPSQDPASRGPFTPLPTPTNNPPTSLGGFPPGMNLNQSATAPPANNAPPSLGGFPPGMNLNQPRPSLAANVQPSSSSGFSPGMNFNQPPSTSNPPPAVPGFLLGMNRNPTGAPQMPPMSGPNNQPTAGAQPNMPPQNQSNDDDNVSRLELDYPIENVLIDANIPSAVAVKVNQAVERDRLGNAFHVHRYAVEPSSQQLSYGDGQQMPSRPIRHSQQSGTRHIREIYNDHHDTPFEHSRHGHGRHRDHRHHTDAHINDYVDRLIQTPGSIVIQADNLNNLQQILGQHQSNVPHLASHAQTGLFQTSAASFPEPIHYYTARALPNDPMRSY